MESVSRQSLLKILNECLKDSNLETVSKAELRKKYLEKTGLTKLPHEDKKWFTSAVNTAYLNYIGNKTTTADIADETKIDEASDDEIKENSEDWKLIMSSSSVDDITPENVNENVINDQFANGENDIKETSGDEIKENSEHEKLIMDSSPSDNISPGNIQENVIDDQFVNGVNDFEMESSSDFDEKLASHKNNIVKKSPLASTLNGFKRQRGKRTLISSSEDETIQFKPTKRNKVLKKARRSSDLEAQPITKSEEKKEVPKSIKNQNCFKKAIIESSDSEDEPLSVFKKKSSSLSGSLNSLTKSDESENECLSKFMKKQFSNPVDSKDESIVPSTKKKTKFIYDLKNHSSDSEDEPVIRFQKSNNSVHSNDENMKFEIKLKLNGSQESMKSKNNSSDSEVENLTKYKKCNDSIHSDKNSTSFSKKKLNSSNKFSKSIESTSGSEDESLAKYSKKKVNNSIVSSDSEDEPLNNFSNRKIHNSNGSKKKPSEKIVEGKVKHSLKKHLSNSSKSKDETLKKKIFVDSDDDSDEQPIVTLAKKSDPVNSSLKSVKNSSDSEDEPLNNMSNKTANSNNSEKEPVEKIVKGKVKHSLKKHITNNNKSKEQTLKKKGFVDADDANISNRKKERFFDGQRGSLLSDSCEDEPLSNMKKEANSSSDSEDEPLSNMKKEANSSSDSEDEPLNKLSTKKSDKNRKNSESGSSSFIDENEEQSSKKNKPSKRKVANDSEKGKKRPSASENKIEHLKKYLRVAGIRISNYNKLFENCKSMKAKCEKMMSLLEKEGLKGRPTLEKCKKLRVKIETKREIAELDVSNILKGDGRPKRSVCSDTTNCKREEEKSTPIKKFSCLQDIVDSEESD